MKYGVHWFRRDLRVAGNAALQKQFIENNGNVLGIFCFDQKFLSREDFSINRFQFFINALVELKKELIELGSDLLVLSSGPEVAFQQLFDDFKKNEINLPCLITWNRDYEPFALKRDQTLEEVFHRYDISTQNFRDHLIIEPHELKKDNGEPYKVYTPFSKKWLEIFKTKDFFDRVDRQKSGFEYLEKRKGGAHKPIFDLTWNQLTGDRIALTDHLEDFRQKNMQKVDIEIPEAGSLAALRHLEAFRSQLASYKEARDFPELNGTSRLSLFLKNGSITTSQILYSLSLKPYLKKMTSQDVFLSEIIWREFYYHILYHFSYCERESFNPKYKDIKWQNDKKLFESWKSGKTGFPIVDAGMRQLNETGWMHNRVRMIVASFLVKDLLIDWRWGEKYFMEKLLDGDLAPNNGGWQWAASTGCDAQPYFRIFNPWLQGKRFDSQGVYIKQYIPELRDMDSKKLHEPILNHLSYPEPIVDHKVQKEKALDLFRNI